jgi:hypothetical protein
MLHPGNNTPDIQGTDGSGFGAGIDERKNLRFCSFPAINYGQSTYQQRQTAPNRSEWAKLSPESNFCQITLINDHHPLNKTSGRY